ncbi:MAG: hypothetical protein QX189_18705, partial [Methylococcales bacterium]
GLFLPHSIEERYDDIQVNDKAFSDLFALFNQYSWNLNDTIGGADNEINPDVLGYIFEKYINQKAFGAYYTRPEITDYLCERTISKLILDRVNSLYDWQSLKDCQSLTVRNFKDLPDLLFKLDTPLCRELLLSILPSLSLLDPACGSGAFLVAAMKTLINIYSAIIGRIKFIHDDGLTQWLKETETAHKNIDYFIKKEIIKNNLYGVDIMPEATEIAKLRLFLALVSSARTVEELEPLPNIDFNIMAGNSLIGLLSVEGEKFNSLGITGDIFRDNEVQSYTQILNEKNRLISNYKDSSSYSESLTSLRDLISENRTKNYKKLNRLLLTEFERLQIKYEQATWDEAKNKLGKPIKRALTMADINSLQPFHWGYEFDAIFARGGFDAIITNPPWEVLKPQAKEFFADYSELVTKNKMTIKDFEKEQDVLLANADIRAAWLDYQSRFSFVSLYYRSSSQYPHQTAVVNGKKTGSDINLYKLFTEQSFNLLKANGECGIVIPSGIYTDLGATGLRKLLFNETDLTGLFCFENNKLIFEGVHRSFKFVVLTFVKIPPSPPFSKGGAIIDGVLSNIKIADAEKGQIPPFEKERFEQGQIPPFEKGGLGGICLSQSFPAAFMRHEVSELMNFPHADSLIISTDLIKKLSPDSWSIMEFKNERDIIIAEKMLRFPLLGEWIDGKPLEFSREFMSSDDHHRFNNEKDGLIVYEGKMFNQFESFVEEPKWWISLNELKKTHFYERGDWQYYRFAIRRVASSTNERTLIATVIPKNSIVVHSVFVNVENLLNPAEALCLVAFLNSFVADFHIRKQVSANVSQFYIYQLPIPRLTEKDPQFKAIVERAAALICTTPEFDDLRAELLESKLMSLDSNREQIRAELDAMIAHCYGLTEDEFAHVLNTFPIVKAEVKAAALAAFKYS